MRHRRARLILWGILFLMYTILQVYSTNTTTFAIPQKKDTGSSTDAATDADDKIKNEESSLKSDEESSQVHHKKPTITDDVTKMPDVHNTIVNSTAETPQTLNVTSTVHTGHHHHPTYRPKRVNCTPPAIEQFPKPLMGPNIRKHGGLVIHVTVAIFTFLGLAIVCDDYFVSSLDRICEELKLSPDVAGATFMAAGSSAPELATVIIGVFFAKDDIGVSGVIGSAVFNIMFVISVCALCSGTVCHLNWWPLVRDCFFYSVSILVMLFTIFNDYISWYEAFIMLIFYVIYCIVLHFNAPLERWAYSQKLPIKLPTKEEQSALVTYKNIPETTTYAQTGQASTSLSKDPQSPGQLQQPAAAQSQRGQDYQSYNDPNASWDPNAAWSDENQTSVAPISSNYMGMQPPTDSWNTNSQWDATGQGQGQQNYGYNAGGAETDQTDNGRGQQQKPQKAIVATTPPPLATAGVPADYYKSKDPRVQDISNPLEKPVNAGLPSQISWAIVYPIHYMCRLTIPDCRTEKYKNWFAFTFLISMIWISFYSYFMVWMITIIGQTLGIPDTVMGLTFVAAGVSVPDALSSIAVIKEGYGDMAVSNAVGSNVFDILICLGLPWFIQTTMIDPGGHVNVISKGLTYSTLSLLSTVVFLLLSVHLNGWKLDKRLGIILMIWYLLFITLASLYELNVFGMLNPKECESDY